MGLAALDRGIDEAADLSVDGLQGQAQLDLALEAILRGHEAAAQAQDDQEAVPVRQPVGDSRRGQQEGL